MNIESWIIEYWWVLFWFLPLSYLYFRQKNKDTVLDMKHSDLQFIIEIGFMVLLIFLIQKYLFPDHLFFLMALPFFILVWCIVIAYLLSGNNVYMLESAIHLEKHYNIKDTEITISQNTKSRLLVMDKSVYEMKEHIGNADYPFWNGNDKLKFCDLYLDSKGIFFHPELPQFHNISIHNARLFLLKIKEDIPKLYRENIMLTWLAPYKTAWEQSKLASKFPLALTAISNQYQHEPFKLIETLDEMYNQQLQESMKTAQKSENLDKTFSETQKEIESVLNDSKPEAK